MRRNHRVNNRSYNNNTNNDNKTDDNMEKVTDIETKIPSNIDDELNIEQDKENAIINTAEVNKENKAENITEHNTKNKSVNPTFNTETKSENNSEVYTKINIVGNVAHIIKVVNETSSENIRESEGMTATTENDRSDFERKAATTENDRSDSERKADTTQNDRSESERKADTTQNDRSDSERKADITENDMTENDMTENDMTEIIINKTKMEEDNVDLPMNEIKEQKEDLMESENQEKDFSDNNRDIVIINKERYEILACEHLFIFHPEYFGISPTWANDQNFQYKCLFELKDNQLYLKSFRVTSDRGYPLINNVKPEIYSYDNGIETVQYNNVNEPLKYSGAIMFANSLVKDYRIPNVDIYYPLCFSYKFAGELIFDEGKLITSVNHNKAMRRIRKNIDLGLRSLDKKQDINCIKKFIKASFIGEYHLKNKKKRNWTENHKNKNISNKNTSNKDVHIMESGKKRYMDKIRQRLKMYGSK